LSNAGRWLYARLLAEVPRIHKEKPIDIIHAHAALPCGHAAALLSRHLNIPFVVTVHGLDVFNNCFQSGTFANWRRKSSIDVYRAAQTTICISGKVERILRDGMPHTTSEKLRTQVVYNGTDTDFFAPASDNSPQPQDELLLIGTMLAGKGQEPLLGAIGQLRDSFPNLRCRMIGEGADRPRFEALASELGIAQRVRFEARKSRNEIADAFRACSIFVLPSRFEGLGCVYLEAMSCGKPVIGCRGQGIDEIIEHGKNGWLIPTWSEPTEVVDELTQLLSTLLLSPDLRSRTGASARETILNGLTLSHQAQRLKQIYNQATGMEIDIATK
jgi:glycosyltransferase involved in cell wall biosynthesis